MDDLLSTFDPLHARSRDALFAQPSSSEISTLPNRPSPSSSSTIGPASINQVPFTEVSLNQAPLDLLHFENDQHNASSDDFMQGGQARQAVTAKASARQHEILNELRGAEQHTDWQSTLKPAFNVATNKIAYNADFSAPVRPGRSGFSPPRRMSRSGLMRDDEASRFHSHHHHDDLMHQSAGTVPKYTDSQSHSKAPPFPFGPASPTGLAAEASELFHPSSPPGGGTLDSLRYANNHFMRARRNSSNSVGRLTSSSEAQSIVGDFSGTHPNRQTEKVNSRSLSSTPSLTTQPAFFLPPPNASNKENDHISPDQTLPKASSPSLSSSSWTSKIKAKSSSRSSDAISISSKQPRKQHTFDFPTTFSDDHPNHKTKSTPVSTTSSFSIDSEPLPPVVLKIPANAESSRQILNDDIADGIRSSLPSRLRLCKSWSLLYSLDVHGTSLTTLYSRVQAGLRRSAGGCILCIQDMLGCIFGAYVNEPFIRREGYYGNGECFLWKMDAFPSSDSFRVGPIVKSYKWTGANDYIILSEAGFVSIGGGNGKFGLWMDKDLDKGYSTQCPAFRNEVLCKPTGKSSDGESEGKFEIMAIECWAVG